MVSSGCGEVIPEPFWVHCSKCVNRLVFEGTRIIYGGRREIRIWQGKERKIFWCWVGIGVFIQTYFKNRHLFPSFVPSKGLEAMMLQG